MDTGHVTMKPQTQAASPTLYYLVWAHRGVVCQVCLELYDEELQNDPLCRFRLPLRGTRWVTAYDRWTDELCFPVETVILALAPRADRSLAAALTNRMDVYHIGRCAGPREALMVVREGLTAELHL